MTNIDIFTDSTADLPEEWAKQHNVFIMGLTVQMGDTIYETVGENRLTSVKLLERMSKGEQPKTSQVNVGDFSRAFRKSVKEGQQVLYLAFSSALSGTYQSACMARELVLEDYPLGVIDIIDTKAASAGEGLLVKAAVALRDSQTPLEEIVEKVSLLSKRVKTYFLVDDATPLLKGGRLSDSSVALPKIRPLIKVQADGSLAVEARYRNSKKALSDFIRLSLESVSNGQVILGYTNNRDLAKEVEALLLAHETVDTVELIALGPVVSAHIGPGTLGIFTISAV